MKYRIVVFALLLVGLVTGCGGGSESDNPADQVKDVNVEFVKLVKDDKLADACALTTNPDGCKGAFALIDNVGAFIPKDLEDKVRAANVTVKGNHAEFKIDGEVNEAERRNGTWLIVYTP